MDTRILENEVKVALKCIEKGVNFILEGGAGSGKTYSLISLIESLIIKSPKIKIACITYTNNAVAEIKSRINNENLWVSTIHEFIWYIIKKYQKEIKNELVLLINDETIKSFKKPKDKDLENNLITIDYFNNIDVEYDEYYSMNPNAENKIKISHDHILILAEKMFEKYKKISDILKDIANCIFVDEYQDTNPNVAKILLEHLKKSNKKNVIGFFGDSMQSIYDEGVGDLNEYKLKKIVKKQNRRNPRIVIEIANKFRDDKIIQIPSKDRKAPNMDENGVIIEGNIKFIYGKEPEDINFLKNKALFKSWNFLNGEQTKELRLTHKYNAEMAGFKKLYNLYNDDLIITLIDKIKKDIDNNENEEKSLNKLVLELRPTYNRKDLFEEITSNEIYKSIYQNIQNLTWKDVLEKCKINKESLMSYKFNGISGRYEANSYRDKILKKLDVLNELIELYESKKFNEFLKKTNFSIQNKNDKSKLKEIMNYFILEDNKTIEEVLDFSKKQGLIKEDIDFDNYINVKGFYLWKRIKKISFKEYRNSILYLKEFSPISTQHSIKGNEFDNVLVVLESNWNKYDFETLFGKGSRNENVIKRTRKLFYVCITRAKKNLVVYMPTEDLEIIDSVKEYFGEENVLSIDSI